MNHRTKGHARDRRWEERQANVHKLLDAPYRPPSRSFTWYSDDGIVRHLIVDELHEITDVVEHMPVEAARQHQSTQARKRAQENARKQAKKKALASRYHRDIQF